MRMVTGETGEAGMRVVRDKRLRWAALGAVVASLAVGGVAYGSTPNSKGEIRACYVTKSGAIRIVDGDTGFCKSSEQPLTWDGAPKLWANVATGGAKVDGTARAAAKLGDGEYKVYFGETDLRHCAPIVTVGGDMEAFRMVDAVVLDREPFNVYVHLEDPDPNPALGNDAPFHIVVQC
jgi:hypothetical protein